MTQRRLPAGDAAGPVRVDAALDNVVGLLDLVRQEEATLRQISDGITLLEAIHRARRTLLDITDAELAEARVAIGSGPCPPGGSAGAPDPQSGPDARTSS